MPLRLSAVGTVSVERKAERIESVRGWERENRMNDSVDGRGE